MDLDPGETRLRKGEGGLRVVLDGVAHQVAQVCRAFPRTAPRRCVELLDADGREIGLIENPDELDAESLALLNAELEAAYFVPTILEIHSVDQKGAGSVWTVLTDQGVQTFAIQDGDALDGSDAPALTVTDQSGKRYRVQDFWELDPHSRACAMDRLSGKMLRSRYGRTGRRPAPRTE